MEEGAPFTAEQVVSVEAKLRDFYRQLPEDEKPIVEALLDLAFAEVSGFAHASLLDLGWSFYPSYEGGLGMEQGGEQQVTPL